MMTHRRYPMKSDVREKKDAYLLLIDLPGCQKEDIKANVEDGYLIVSASIHEDKEKGTGKYLRKESFSGEFRRNFYVGSKVRQEDIKASYKRGVLKLLIPKKDTMKPENNKIQII